MGGSNNKKVNQLPYIKLQLVFKLTPHGWEEKGRNMEGEPKSIYNNNLI